jgi:inorganic pyrophosphatase
MTRHAAHMQDVRNVNKILLEKPQTTWENYTWVKVQFKIILGKKCEDVENTISVNNRTVLVTVILW